MLSLLTRMPCAYDKQSLIKQHQQEKKKWGKGAEFDIQSLEEGRKKTPQGSVKPQPGAASSPLRPP